MPDTETHALTAAADGLLALDRDPALPLTPHQRATLRRFAQRLQGWANSPTTPTRVPDARSLRKGCGRVHEYACGVA
jgi:hypothetical protein